MPQGSVQGHFQGCVGDAGNIARDLLERAVADDVVGADAQDLPLPEAAEGPQHGRVLECRIHFRLKLVLHLLLVRAAPQGNAQHVDVVRVGHQKIAEELAGAQELQERFQTAAARLEQTRQLLGAGRIGQETLKVVEGHVRVGTARQQAAEGRREFAQ